MPEVPPEEITRLLHAWNDGDSQALDKLAALVESDLRRLAQIFMQKERAEHTLQPTALMSETFIRLMQWKNPNCENRVHFMRVAAAIMRRVLVDHARRRDASAELNSHIKPTTTERGANLVALDDALKQLAELDRRKSEIVELRFFGGYSVAETAEILGISPMTVKRDWNVAQAWLRSELDE